MKSPFLNRREPKEDLVVEVKTGDKQGAGTDCKIWLILHDDKGRTTLPLRLNNRFITNCRNQVCRFKLQSKMSDLRNITLMEFWLENFGLGALWYVEYFRVKILGEEERVFIFPVHRWMKPRNNHFLVVPNDSSLPQFEASTIKEQRVSELKDRRQEYRYIQHVEGGPMQTAILPGDEKFSDEYYWSFAKEKLALLAKTKFIMWTTQKWKSFPALKSVLTKSLGDPECSSVWDTDEWFGLQRLQGLNPFVLKHCVEIPEKLDVTEETVSGLLGDLSLKEALEQNKLFICDLDILDGVVCKDNRKMGAPIALFYLKSPDLLLPIAIQLYQQKGPLNPVFTPKDPHNTWLVAKMYYNNCEAQHHQGVTHLGYTHLLMEGVCVCSHRNLSPSHPVFKLMAPHFLFLLAINSRGLEKLISKGGWVDGCMTQGIEGIYEVIRRGFQRHNFSSYGNVEAEIKSRGLLDPEILPYYPYRDDAISLFKIIREYVAKVINHYYDTKEKLTGDWELREWRQELSIPREKGGVGMVGVPGNDIKGFADVEELIETVAIIISTCSLGHAAANFQQYEQYGFVPNYPGILMRDPPTKKINYTESEILEILPDMKTTLDTMVITKLLSNRGTNSLGDFEMQYLYHPTDVQAADEFRKELKKLSLEVKKRNIDRRHPFLWLDPETVPNAISI